MSILIHALQFLALISVFIVVLAVTENIYWRKRNPEKTYTLGETLLHFSLGASYKMCDALAIMLYIYFFYDIIAGIGLSLHFDNRWLEYAFTFIVVDLFFYVTHLVMHKVRWFWTGHEVHHSGLRFNYSTALRQNLTVVINGTTLVWWMPLALMGLDKEVVLLCMEANLLYQFLVHTEMPNPLDRHSGVLNTPALHRIHHGRLPEQIDKNLGGTLIIWDRLFGTYLAPAQSPQVEYGVTRKQLHTLNPVALVLHEWREMFADFRRTRDVRVFLRDPGWVDRQPRHTREEAVLPADANELIKQG